MNRIFELMEAIPSPRLKVREYDSSRRSKGQARSKNGDIRPTLAKSSTLHAVFLDQLLVE